MVLQAIRKRMPFPTLLLALYGKFLRNDIISTKEVAEVERKLALQLESLATQVGWLRQRQVMLKEIIDGKKDKISV